MSNKKRNIALVLLIIVIILLGFFSVLYFKNLNKKSENDYISEFTKMGEEFYSNYYYRVISTDKTDEQVKEYLSKFNTLGLKIDLNELEKYNDEYKNVIENFTNDYKYCKKDETMIIIYPKEPYSNSDYELNIKMDCNKN